MPMPFAPLLNDQLVSLPLAARATGLQVILNTNQVTYIAWDTNVTAFTGGTAPTIAFTLERLGADGVWYMVYNPTPTGSPQTVSTDIGPGFPNATGTQHAVFTTQARFTVIYTGAPTSITYSASLLGR